MPDFLNFVPLFRNSYGQTVAASLLDFDIGVLSQTHLVHIADGDILAYEESLPATWTPQRPILALVHGLCGSHRSHYMKRLARKAYNEGWGAVRINLRGCGSGKGLARNIYHSGSSKDVQHVLSDLQKRHSGAIIYLAGFSMGGNIVLKLCGELKERANELIQGVIAVSPPVDLLSSARLFAHPDNHFYERYFLRLLLEEVNYIHQTFPDLPAPNLPKNLSINDFDELYVAVRANFPSALDYYRVCSSKRVVQDICIPGKILLSIDDPIISHTSLDDTVLPKNLSVYKTEYGGHVGYIGSSLQEFRWMDVQIFKWLSEFEQERSK